MNILVVDDEALVGRDTVEILKELSYPNAQSVKSGEEAIKKVRSENIDVVFMDINLKSKTLNGIQAVKEIQKIQKEIIIIYATANHDVNIMDEALDTNPEYYLHKPYSDKDIILAFRIIKKNTPLPHKESIHYFFDKRFAYDAESKQLFHNGIEIKIQKRDIKFLELIIANIKVGFLTYEQIDDCIWGDKSISESTRRSLKHKLNAKFNGRLLKNKSGIGYEIQIH